MSTPSTAQLKRALKISEKIEALKSELNQIFGGGKTSSPSQPKAHKGISAAGRKAIAAAQKKRWKKLKGATGAKPAKKGRRKMSPAAKAKMAAAARARWAKAKAAGKTKL